MRLRFTYPKRVTLVGIAVMVCGPILGVLGGAAADAATTTTTLAPKPSTTTTKPSTTTTSRPPRRHTACDHDGAAPGHDNDGTGDTVHFWRTSAGRPVNDHHDGAPACGQPAQH